jgi:hypothetical protein
MGRILESVLAGIMAITSMSGIACTPDNVPKLTRDLVSRDVKEGKDFIGLIEGMWTIQTGEAMKGYADRFSNQLGLSAVAVSGNGRSLIPLAQEAHRNGRKVYLGGYSLGDDNAEDIARECNKLGIPIEILFLLDGTDAKQIPPNVERVVYFRGTADTYAFRGKTYKRENLENPETMLEVIPLNTTHLGVPNAAYGTVRDILRRDQRK